MTCDDAGNRYMNCIACAVIPVFTNLFE
ncbi:MAG: hypothetical protein LZF64_00065 [Nitrosomonas sp.]|nr:MAG: hypothetical protein LZF64_00065 [Nitrosomonas sp.]